MFGVENVEKQRNAYIIVNYRLVAYIIVQILLRLLYNSDTINVKLKCYEVYVWGHILHDKQITVVTDSC